MPSATSPDLPGDRIYTMDLLGTGRTQMVYYHSGRYVNGAWVPGTGWEVFAPIDVASTGQALDRIHQVTNGLGATAKVEYVDGVVNGIVRQTGNRPLTYPLRAVRGAGKIVGKLKVGTGSGNTATTSYVFEDPATDASGMGSPGFAVIQSTDEQSGLVTRTERRQDWPYLGLTRTSTVTDRNGVVLSNTVHAHGVELRAQANGSTTVCPVTRQSTTVRRDLSDPENSNFGGYALATSTTANTYSDGWCNINVQSTTTVDDKYTFNSTTTTDYLNDSGNWFIGLPKKSVVSRSDSSATTPSLPRTSKNDYDAKGMLYVQTVEPDDVNYKVVTTLDRSRNPFGLVNSKILTWSDPATNEVMQSVEQVAYDPNGRFAATLTNSLQQTETHTYYEDSGTRSSSTGPNGLQTFWKADGFGRVSVEKRADGNETRFYQKFCRDCPANAVVASIIDSFHGGDRVTVPQVSYADEAGHVLRNTGWTFDGRMTVTDSRYDALGRLAEADHPRFIADSVVLSSRRIYDDLNRPKRVESFDTAGALMATTTEYRGLTQIQTNALGRKRVELRDALGQLREVVQKRVADGADVKTSFGYEAFGGLSSTEDPNKNVITLKYDKLGRKTELLDPNLGRVVYEVDPLGRVWRQISPKQRAAGQSTTFRFDLLGRMTARYETDLESHWVYDQQQGTTCAATHSCGQLIEAYTQAGSTKDYDRVQTYDDLARLSLVTEMIGDGTANATFRTTTDYDPWNRQIRVTYQRNADRAKVFDSRYNKTGYLERLERGALVLWKLQLQDAASRPIQTVLGNGLIQTRGYNRNTSWLEDAILVTKFGRQLLLENYLYDRIGNVSSRTQFWDEDGFTETFLYDELNRLKESKVGIQEQLFTYDDAGNLKSKTGGDAGVGGVNYVYPPQGNASVLPHAVRQVDTGIYEYDLNGNMKIAPQGRSYTWSSFDMPLVITKDTISSSFVYGPEHQRTRQTRSDGSVEVYGGAQVTETKGGVLTVKTYWPFGAGVEIDVGTAPTELNWVHADRLGSPVAISDVSGALNERLAYDAWGKRRSTDGKSTPDKLDGVIDNRGFTNHEMLDQLELVHMNGRLYDPSIGRFVTADPLIGDPTNGQNYNRYSYVLNNPTNLTDPTGFAAEDCSKPDSCVTSNKQECTKDCKETDKDGNVIHYSVNADGEAEVTKVEHPPAKSQNGQNKENAKLSAGTGGGQDAMEFAFGIGTGLVNEVLKSGREMKFAGIPFFSFGEISDALGLPSHQLDETGSSEKELGVAVAPIVAMAMPGSSGKKRVFSWLGRANEHHLIPKAVYEKYKHLFPEEYLKDHAENLAKFMTPFHGNHPRYNKYVASELDKLLKSGDLTMDKLRDLQNKLRAQLESLNQAGAKRINQAYKDMGY